MAIEFIDPQPVNSDTQGFVWIPKLLPLLDHPGRWARVEQWDNPKRGSIVVHNMRTGIIRMPRGIWKVRAQRRTDAPGSEVFVMFVRPDPVEELRFGRVLPGVPGRPRNDGLDPIRASQVPFTHDRPV